jgi:hypothetical protein
MDHMLPCDYFLRGGDYRWPVPVTRNDRDAGRKFELEGLVRVIRKYESVFGIEHPDHCYEEFKWDEPDDGRYVERLMRYRYLPADFLEFYLMDVCPRDRTVMLDLELLRRVHRWYMTDVEE